ncbi:MAG TPA: hypothetical protein VEQ10_20000, partial [Vicinamibacteria bacterium]|nr:hypothetical protein [Vicinamibacteria bacterium]
MSHLLLLLVEARGARDHPTAGRRVHVPSGLHPRPEHLQTAGPEVAGLARRGDLADGSARHRAAGEALDLLRLDAAVDHVASDARVVSRGTRIPEHHDAAAWRDEVVVHAGLAERADGDERVRAGVYAVAVPASDVAVLRA